MPALSLDDLARLGRDLAALDPLWGFEAGEPDRRDGWLRPADVTVGHAAAWLVEQERRVGAGRTVAAAYLAIDVEYRLTGALTAALLTAPVMPDPGPRDTFLTMSPHGHTDTVRLASSWATVTASGDAESRLAAALVRTLEPIVTAIRAASGFPLAGVWGMVADTVARTAVQIGRRRGGDGVQRCWARAQLVLDGLAAHGAHLRRRPRLVTAGAAAPRLVRGTCCRYYATPEARDGPPEDRWCTTCPAGPANRGLPPETPLVRSLTTTLTGSHL